MNFFNLDHEFQTSYVARRSMDDLYDYEYYYDDIYDEIEDYGEYEYVEEDTGTTNDNFERSFQSSTMSNPLKKIAETLREAVSNLKTIQRWNKSLSFDPNHEQNINY